MVNIKGVKAKNGSFVCIIDGKVACTMANGGAHFFLTQTQAEVFGGHYSRGWTGGTFLGIISDTVDLIEENQYER